MHHKIKQKKEKCKIFHDIIVIKYSIPVAYLKLYLTYYVNQNCNNALLQWFILIFIKIIGKCRIYNFSHSVSFALFFLSFELSTIDECVNNIRWQIPLWEK